MAQASAHPDYAKLTGAGFSPDFLQKFVDLGGNLAQLLQWLNQYGPSIVQVITTIIALFGKVPPAPVP